MKQTLQEVYLKNNNFEFLKEYFPEELPIEDFLYFSIREVLDITTEEGVKRKGTVMLFYSTVRNTLFEEVYRKEPSYLKQALRKGNATPTAWNLRSSISTGYEEKGKTTLAEVFRDLNDPDLQDIDIQYLDLSHNRFDVASLGELCLLFPLMPNLHYVDLSHNQFSADQPGLLSLLLSKPIEFVNICGNPIAFIGREILAEMDYKRLIWVPFDQTDTDCWEQIPDAKETHKRFYDDYQRNLPAPLLNSLVYVGHFLERIAKPITEGSLMKFVKLKAKETDEMWDFYLNPRNVVRRICRPNGQDYRQEICPPRVLLRMTNGEETETIELFAERGELYAYIAKNGETKKEKIYLIRDT